MTEPGGEPLTMKSYIHALDIIKTCYIECKFILLGNAKLKTKPRIFDRHIDRLQAEEDSILNSKQVIYDFVVFVND